MRARLALLFGLSIALAGSAFTGPASAQEAQPAPIEATDAQIARALGSPAPKAAVLYDPSTRAFLLELNPTKRLAPASLIKMATALVAAEALAPGDEVTISRKAARAPHDRVRWPEGRTFTADQVLHGLMLESSNGAAIALAETISGSVAEFNVAANERMAELGATATTVADPSGLDAKGQLTTARDLALMAAAVLEDPWLAAVVRTRSYKVPWTKGQLATFRTINRYLLSDPTAVGVKTGYTSQAGDTMAAAATRKGRTLIAIALDGPKLPATAKRMLDLGFAIAGPAPVSELASLAQGADPMGPRVTERSNGSQKGAGRPMLLRLLVAAGIVAYARRFYRAHPVLPARKRPLPRAVPVEPAASEVIEVPFAEEFGDYSEVVEAPQAMRSRS